MIKLALSSALFEEQMCDTEFSYVHAQGLLILWIYLKASLGPNTLIIGFILFIHQFYWQRGLTLQMF